MIRLPALFRRSPSLAQKLRRRRRTVFAMDPDSFYGKRIRALALEQLDAAIRDAEDRGA